MYFLQKSVQRQSLAIFKKFRDQLLNDRWGIFMVIGIPIIFNIISNIVIGTLLGYIIFQRKLVIQLIEERQQKHKELLKIMSVDIIAYNIGIMMYGYLVGLILVIIFMIFSKQSILLFGILGICTITSINFSLCFSRLFRNPKFGGELYSLLFLGLYIFCCIISASSYNLSRFNQYIASLLIPQAPLIFSLAQMYSSQKPYIEYTELYIVSIISSVLYGVLYYYLDQVLPDDYGLRKPLLWFLQKKTNQDIQGEEYQNLSQNIESSLINLQNDDQASSAKYNEQYSGNRSKQATAVLINQLTKKFGGNTVINNVSFRIYQNEIFGLLGHNGAGKTVSLSIIAGILTKTNGKIYINQQDIDSNMDDIRNSISFCCQSNVVFDYLSVEKHLKLISEIKGIQSELIQQQIEDILFKVGLTQEKSKLAKDLSGGNKRKLNLGMTLIGDPSVIFLDEPTSGLDPESRRGVWDIIQKLRSDGKTIILTTHHLDEADTLCDRIAIMNKGKLHTLGTPDFIKKTFGQGYNLNIQFQQDSSLTNKQKLRNIIKYYIPNAVEDQQVQQSIMRFLLPFDDLDQYSQLLEKLENEQNVQLSLEMNSLEEAFMNIINEEKSDQQEQIINTDDTLTNRTSQQQYIPEQLLQSYGYSFMSQLIGLLRVKLLQTIRNPYLIMLHIIPILMVYPLASLCISVNKPKTGSFGRGFDEFFIIIFLGLINLIFNSVYCVGVTKDNTNLLLRGMGIRSLPYWISHFVFDSILYIIRICIYQIVLVLSNDRQQYLDNEQINELVVLFSCVGLANILFCYCCSFLFTKSNRVTLLFIGLQIAYNMLSHLLILLIKYVSQSIFTINKIPEELIRHILSPHSNIMQGTIEISQKKQNQVIPFYYQALISSAILLIILMYLILRSKQYQKSNIKYDLNENQLEQSVKNERENIQYNFDILKDRIVVKSLKKAYHKENLVVKDISFSVQKQQIFGLLGHSGAGKSTCLNILSGFISNYAGKIKIQNQILDSIDPNIFQNIGICPQVDSLWDNLTVLEHIEIYAKIKGLPSQVIQEAVKYYLNVMDLDIDSRKLVTQLSGGKKRRVNVILALLGAPSILYLDEPTKFMDSFAANNLKKILNDYVQRRKATAILCTNQIQEAEQICEKIGMIVEGQLVCIGSVAELKNKFVKGYQILIKKKNGVQTDIHSIITNQYPDAQLLISDYLNGNSIQENQVRYQIPVDKMKVSQAFELLNNHLKKNRLIEDFSLVYCTLEEIFLSVARNRN